MKSEHLKVLQSGVDHWNQWRQTNEVTPDLRGADLRRLDLRHCNFEQADLRDADFRESDLSGATSKVAISGMPNLTTVIFLAVTYKKRVCREPVSLELICARRCSHKPTLQTPFSQEQDCANRI